MPPGYPGPVSVIAILNGPNLNLLGKRQPQIYGHETLEDLHRRCERRAERYGMTVDCRQTNHEGQMIDWIHELRTSVAGVVMNAGGWTHTSVALRDALVTVAAPFIEVHISNVHAREDFRHHSYLSAVAAGVIAGCGTLGYELAIDVIAEGFAGETVGVSGEPSAR